MQITTSEIRISRITVKYVDPDQSKMQFEKFEALQKKIYDFVKNNNKTITHGDQ